MTDCGPEADGTTPSATSPLTENPPNTFSSIQDNLLLLVRLQHAYTRHLQEHIDAGLLLTRREFSTALAVNDSEIDALLREGRLIELIMARSESYYPAFLTQPNRYPVQALGQVLKILEGLSDVEKYHFMSSPSHFLGGQRPIAALDSDKFSAVLYAARAFAAS